MFTIIYHLQSDKKTIIDIKLYKSLVINFVSDKSIKNKKHTTTLIWTISIHCVTL